MISRAHAARLALLAACSCGGRDPGAGRGAASPAGLGQQVTYTLVSNDGEPTTIPIPGRITVLEYWAPTCKPCSATLPRVAAMRNALRARGAELVLVAILADDESTAQAEQTLAEWHVAGERFLIDRDEVSVRNAAVTTLPTTQVLDAAGILRWFAQEPPGPNDLLSAVDAAR
jgi:thiol-disulfide isomerase/thioredoxin